MTLRILPPAEYDRVVPIFAEYGGEPPDPEMGRIVVAEHEGQIVGFAVGQLAMHLEPLWVAPRYRGTGLWKHLVEGVKSILQPGAEFYAFAPRPGIEHMAQQSGLEKMPWAVYRGIR